ncbi:MAG: DUF1232 domain-containing protein [Bacteroidaceae bacterium]|nr:DUF1232 domain-containing protein [Bacteroidaceae bacterium]
MSENFDPKKVELKKYEKEYSEDGLWDKIASVAKKAGLEVIYYALLLFYALQSPNVTVADKAKIIGALGYFILPLDLIPDFIPVAGYVDDGGLLLLVIKALSCIDERVKQQAKSKLKEWFGNYDESKLKF